MYHFASDNNAGMCPQALAAMIEANSAGHAPGYGGDKWTDDACAEIRKLFEADCAVFFVFNGTASNALALAQICRPYHAVIAHELSHIETDEAGAPGFFSGGATLLGVDGPNAKITTDDIERLCTGGRGFHHVKPRAISLTQSTELGTAYTVSEVKALTASARKYGLRVHMDGARLANAAASLGCNPADVTWRAGVDVLSFGGVKNGLGVGEAVVIFDPLLAEEFEWRVKQAGQLNSKMRLVAAAWLGLLRNGVWLANARHANAMAHRLAAKIQGLPGLRLIAPVEANGVFIEMPVKVQAAVRDKGWRFYTFLGETGCRLMCAWDTPEATVDAFAADVAEAARG